MWTFTPCPISDLLGILSPCWESNPGYCKQQPYTSLKASGSSESQLLKITTLEEPEGKERREEGRVVGRKEGEIKDG